MANTRKAVPADDLNVQEFEFQGETYAVKKKFKIAKFFKKLNSEPIDAIELALTEESYNKFEDLEMDMDDLKEFLEGLSGAMAGTTAKN